jgi:hypothetical protein
LLVSAHEGLQRRTHLRTIADGSVADLRAVAASLQT